MLSTFLSPTITEIKLVLLQKAELQTTHNCCLLKIYKCVYKIKRSLFNHDRRGARKGIKS